MVSHPHGDHVWSCLALLSLGKILKGTSNEDASWHENLKIVQCFPFASLVWLFCQYLQNKSTFCFKSELPRPTAMLGPSYQLRSEKRLSLLPVEVRKEAVSWHTYASGTELVHNVTHRKHQRQNGSILLAMFKMAVYFWPCLKWQYTSGHVENGSILLAMFKMAVYSWPCLKWQYTSGHV